jgi:hypothetical protein
VDPIPQPQVLDPDRILDPQRDNFTSDHESRADMYQDGLRQSCAYAQQLWQTLDGVREYLMESLPPDPRTPGTHVTCASPTGPDDEEGWMRWIDMFSTVTSVMCGPHGDSGFGYGQARETAQTRRTVERTPVPEVVVPQLDEPTASEAGRPDADSAEDESPATSSTLRWARLTAGVLVSLLAVRGLLPRRRG